MFMHAYILHADTVASFTCSPATGDAGPLFYSLRVATDVRLPDSLIPAISRHPWYTAGFVVRDEPGRPARREYTWMKGPERDTKLSRISPAKTST